MRYILILMSFSNSWGNQIANNLKTCDICTYFKEIRKDKYAAYRIPN